VRTKTAYRKSAENIPPPGEATAPAIEAPAVAVEVQPQPELSQPDETALALQRQIDALARSEALQRQAAEQQLQPQRPMSREDRLAVWRMQGMPEVELKFLTANPALVDMPQLTAYAANEALQQGHERGSEAFLNATKLNFDKHLQQLQAQAQTQTPTEPAMTPTPKFFEPPPAPKPRGPQGPIVSAPVSREVPTGEPRPEYQQDPRRVTLSVEERQVAAASGISEVTYAANKLKMLRMKAAGEIQ
jgi:hypothetical protein